MQSIKTFVSVASFAICMGAASMASAASVGPDGPFTTSAGTLVVKSPSSYNAAVSCGITFSGNVSGGIATITGATLTGGGLCGLPVLKNIPSPGWVLTASSGTAGTVANVGYTIAKTFLYPATDCGPTTINVLWNATTHTLTAASQALSGSCTIDSLSVVAPTLTVTP